jgi:hypothetical protein
MGKKAELQVQIPTKSRLQERNKGYTETPNNCRYLLHLLFYYSIFFI